MSAPSTVCTTGPGPTNTASCHAQRLPTLRGLHCNTHPAAVQTSCQQQRTKLIKASNNATPWRGVIRAAYRHTPMPGCLCAPYPSGLNSAPDTTCQARDFRAPSLAKERVIIEGICTAASRLPKARCSTDCPPPLRPQYRTRPRHKHPDLDKLMYQPTEIPVISMHPSAMGHSEIPTWATQAQPAPCRRAPVVIGAPAYVAPMHRSPLCPVYHPQPCSSCTTLMR